MAGTNDPDNEPVIPERGPEDAPDVGLLTRLWMWLEGTSTAMRIGGIAGAVAVAVLITVLAQSGVRGSKIAVTATSSDPPAASGPITGQGEVTVGLTGEVGPGGSPVVVTVTLTNQTDDDVILVRPDVIPNFVALTVTDGTGTRLPYLGPQVRLIPLDDDGFVHLAPGESTSETFALEPFYDFSPGTYSISAEYVNPARGSHEGTRAITFEPDEGPMSEPIDVEIPS